MHNENESDKNMGFSNNDFVGIAMVVVGGVLVARLGFVSEGLECLQRNTLTN